MVIKISEVAKSIDLPISTIRYYEQIGIITDEYVLRDQNNYRIYSSDIIHHLNVVKQCLAVGFSIQEIKSMISKNGMSKDEQVSLIQLKIAEIEATQQQLNVSKQNLYDILSANVTCEKGFGKI
ncbi:helix-turn-helix domain-containing protein [Paenibacillus massiliensis]|uniref:helix-turn-helix domain-containing protein n=1 Tax=Paenibacillus massiliensis TaxID=225917 RepID=UPI0004198607|nr:MerR family transcriptional regulator [Paenibacillus massiliensis]